MSLLGRHFSYNTNGKVAIITANNYCSIVIFSPKRAVYTKMTDPQFPHPSNSGSVSVMSRILLYNTTENYIKTCVWKPIRICVYRILNRRGLLNGGGGGPAEKKIKTSYGVKIFYRPIYWILFKRWRVRVTHTTSPIHYFILFLLLPYLRVNSIDG